MSILTPLIQEPVGHNFLHTNRAFTADNVKLLSAVFYLIWKAKVGAYCDKKTRNKTKETEL